MTGSQRIAEAEKRIADLQNQLETALAQVAALTTRVEALEQLVPVPG